MSKNFLRFRFLLPLFLILHTELASAGLFKAGCYGAFGKSREFTRECIGTCLAKVEASIEYLSANWNSITAEVLGRPLAYRESQFYRKMFAEEGIGLSRALDEVSDLNPGVGSFAQGLALFGSAAAFKMMPKRYMAKKIFEGMYQKMSFMSFPEALDGTIPKGALKSDLVEAVDWHAEHFGLERDKVGEMFFYQATSVIDGKKVLVLFKSDVAFHPESGSGWSPWRGYGEVWFFDPVTNKALSLVDSKYFNENGVFTIDGTNMGIHLEYPGVGLVTLMRL